MKISEIITDKYKLRIPPTVYYELLADVQEAEDEQESAIGVDCISRKAALDITWHDPSYSDPLNVLTEVRDKIRELPSVTPQEPQIFKWCTDCKEYDQEKHCCHRWSKAIRDTVEEMKQEQEPKTGHWIANAPQYDMLNPQYICSGCGNAHTRTTPYCEMCGAKMVEP